MTRVIADISMSLDGFVTGPDPDVEHGLGHGGEPLHTWAIDSDDEVDAKVLADATGLSGAVVMGRRLFGTIDGPKGWNDEMGYGAGTPLFGDGGARRELVHRSCSCPRPPRTSPMNSMSALGRTF